MRLGVVIGNILFYFTNLPSQKLAPEYSQAAKDLKEEGIILAKIDATV